MKVFNELAGNKVYKENILSCDKTKNDLERLLDNQGFGRASAFSTKLCFDDIYQPISSC